MSADGEPDGRLPLLRVDIVTLFPNLLTSWLDQGVVSRSVRAGTVSVNAVNLREHGVGRHRVTDDYPFGGGAGMVMKPEPLFAAVESLAPPPATPVILMSPGGRPFTQRTAEELARLPWFVVLCGHYEGVDERVRRHLATQELSIGDYVLSAGELAAMVVVDAVVRLVPGVLSPGSTREESFSHGLLEYPQYTRPAVFRGWSVPEILLSGHHAEIERWREQEAVRRTEEARPDMLSNQAAPQDDPAARTSSPCAEHTTGDSDTPD